MYQRPLLDRSEIAAVSCLNTRGGFSRPRAPDDWPSENKEISPALIVAQPAASGTSSGTLEQPTLSILISSGRHPSTPIASCLWRDRSRDARAKFTLDSPLEGDGFERSVPVAREPVYIAEVNWGGLTGQAKKILRGTEGSNPSPSSGESAANLIGRPGFAARVSIAACGARTRRARSPSLRRRLSLALSRSSLLQIFDARRWRSRLDDRGSGFCCVSGGTAKKQVTCSSPSSPIRPAGSRFSPSK